MGLSRKRKRELNRLKGHAEELWGDQKKVLEHANQIVREASHQASNYAREEVTPKVRGTLEDRVFPVVSTGVSATKHAATGARNKIVDDVLPAVSSAIGSALAVLEVAKDQRVREILKRVDATSSAVSERASDLGNKASDLSHKASKKADKLSKKAHKVSKEVSKQVNKRIAAVKPAPKPGPGRYILIGVGVVALAGIAYAAWQTLRADDDLWIDEDDVLPEQERSKPVDDTV